MSNQPNISHLLQRVNELRAKLARVNPQALAGRVGAEWILQAADQGELRLPVWGQPVRLTCPGYVACDLQTGQELSIDLQALLLYHFSTSDGSPLDGRWISFAELPDGLFYNKAFQGYTGNELVRAFRSSYDDFGRAAERLGGLRLSFGDASFSFRALPRLALMAVFWRGDEDFPASIQILFDANAGRHLSTDMCAILGSMLTRRLIKA